MEILSDRFKRYIGENDLLRPGDRVLLAVSGGVDSMVMLSLFAASEWPAAVAHCNFGLRGEEGDQDTELVRAEAARCGLECHVKNFDTAAEVERTGESIQMAARRLRYDWFGKLCATHGYTAIAIAHQSDDSVETFFINLFRGTGLRGLTGISPVNGRVVRPLLFATRREITEWALAGRIAFREDSSNRSTKYLRNKIRLGLVPRLREINPRFTEMMRHNVDRLTQTQGFIDAAIARIGAEIVTREGRGAIIEVEKIDPAFPVGFVAYELLSSRWGFRGDVIDGIVAALARGDSGRRFYSRDNVAFTDRGRIIVEPIEADDPCEVAVERTATRVYAGNSVYYLSRMDIDQLETLVVGENTALLDADTLTWPLTLRRWRAGDRFTPLGMSGSKKVSDFLVDAKVPVPEKERQFVLVSAGDAGSAGDGGSAAGDAGSAGDGGENARSEGGIGENDEARSRAEGGEIVWLTGRRTDERFKITPRTENVLKIVREII
ncbi:MAG: tRNA lysidine(34) synthetase TilS [Alistipes sp.]|jgi:tRNA(Ile)-lysidine synthase|nr:tRNA lysidine(34) synthetase TilS [Alistipes sp.]